MKKIIKSFFERFVLGGHLISLSAASFVFSTCVLLGKSFSWQLFFIPYLLSQVIYSYNHLREKEFDTLTNPERTNFISKSTKRQRYKIVFYLLFLLITLVFTNIVVFIFSFVFLMGGILYTDYFKSIVTKYFIALKNFYVSLFWGALVFLVCFYYSLNSYSFFIYFSLYVFSWSMLNTTFYDIKDIESDRARNLKTIPAIFGKTKTIHLLQIVNFLSLSFLLMGVYQKVLPPLALSLSFFYVYGLIYLLKSYKTEGKALRILSYTMVDGEPLLLPLILLFSNMFL